jgi:c-di-GMP-binding flagellar brake protein YcgR
MSNPARRRHYRVQVDPSSRLFAEFLRGGQVSRRYSLRDVSLGGLSVVLPPGEQSLLGPGDELNLRLHLPGRPGAISARASVVRREALPPDTQAAVVAQALRGSASSGPKPGDQADLLGLKMLDSSGLAQQLDPAAWVYFNRRSHQRGDLSRERAEVRLLSSRRSLRAELHDLSLAGLGLRWNALRSEPPAVGERFRIGLRLEAQGELLTYEAGIVHVTSRSGGLRLGLAFDADRSPRLSAQAHPVGRALVRVQLAGSRAGPAS